MEKRIGIIGLGCVGKSALRFFQDKSAYSIATWDACRSETQTLEQFIQEHDEIIPSPGVDLRPYLRYKNKFRCELDLFAPKFFKKTIAITGTLGKTTLTRMLGDLIPGKTAIAGNIGYPMLDLIARQNEIETAVLELSSFQLEQSKLFAPDIAIFTNFYPNHLDRHTTMSDYFDAKWRLFENQTPNQYALLPNSFLVGEWGSLLQNRLKTYRGKVVFVEDGHAGYEQNGLLAQKVLELCGQTLPREASSYKLDNHSLDSHRLEHFTTHNTIDFYNDSKATVIQATQAAVKKLAANNRPIILVVGGLSKGVDRTPLVRFLQNQTSIKKIFYLGKGCDEFACYEQYSSLQDLVHAIMQAALPGDQVLFSPSGASFDLFKNFEERGDLFKHETEKYLAS